MMCLNFFCLCLAAAVGFCAEPTAAQSQNHVRTVSGFVREAQTLQPLRGVNVLLLGTPVGATCDSSGRFALQIPTSRALLQIQHIGYRAERLPLPPSVRDTLLAILLLPETLSFPQVEVEAEREPRLATSVRVQARDLHDLPAAANDALAALKILPAVTSNNEMTSGFSVQGGSPEENLILLEGLELPRPQRVRNSAQENFSPLNNMLVSNLTFHAAGFPTRYGERLSSVLLAHYRSHSERKLQGEAELSFMNAGLMLEAQPNPRLHWAFAGRFADRSLLLRTLQTQGALQPRAYDAQALLHYKLAQRHRLLVLGMYGENAFRSEPRSQTLNAQSGLRDFIAYRTSFSGYENFAHLLSLLSLQLESQITSRLSLWQSIALTQSREQEEVNKRLTIESGPVQYFSGEILYLSPLSTQTQVRDNYFNERTLQYHALLRGMLSSTSDFEAGLRLERRSARDEQNEFTQTSKPDSVFLPRILLEHGTDTNNLFAAFINYGRQFNSQWRLELGVRENYFAASREAIIQPRARLTYKATASTTFSAAWGRYAQPASYWERRPSSAFPQDATPAQRAAHWVAGVQHQPDDTHELNAQVFYKKIAPAIPYRVEDILLRFEPESEARAQVYGASVYFKLRISPRWTSWLAYTFLEGRQKIAGEGSSRLPTDQRHTLVALLQDEMPAVKGSRMHVRAILGSGYPFAPAPANFSSATTTASLPRDVLSYGRYRRIDLGVSYTLSPLPNVEGRVSCEVFNVFDFRNLLTYSAFEDAQGQLRFARVNLSGRWFNVRLNVEF